MVIANRTFPVSPSSFINPPVPPGVPAVVVSLCPGRHLCPGVPVCNFSFSVAVVIYIPGVPVVICVPMSLCVISSINKHDVTRHTDNLFLFIYTSCWGGASATPTPSWWGCFVPPPKPSRGHKSLRAIYVTCHCSCVPVSHL